MNVWVFNHAAVTPDIPGGSRHYDFGKELIKRGRNVTIFAGNIPHKLRRSVKLADNEKWKVENFDGVNFVWIRTFPYQKNDWRRVINMLSYARRAYFLGKKIATLNTEIKKPDVIIGSSVPLFAVYTAYLLANYHKVPFVMEVRDLWPQTLISMGIPRWHPFVIFLGFLERFLYKKAKKIITLLPKAHEYIENLNIKTKEIVYIPNGVYLDRYKKSEEYNVNKSGEFTIMYIGAFLKPQRLDIVPGAARILLDRGYQGFRFILIGNGPDRENIMRLSEKIGVNNIECPGLMPKNRVYDMLGKADVFFTSLRNSPKLHQFGISPNKLCDYLAAGRPVIFAPNPAANNLVKEAGAGVTIPMENPEALAEAIIRIHEMPPAERKNMGENGRRYAEKYLSIPILTDKLEALLTEVTEK